MGLDVKGRCLGELVERVEEHVRVQCEREGAVGVGGLGAGEGGEEGKSPLTRLPTHASRTACCMRQVTSPGAQRTRHHVRVASMGSTSLVVWVIAAHTLLL